MIEEILSDLQKRYDCSSPIYLSDFFQPGGDQRLYNKLKELHQPAYDNRYRIIVVQDCADVYDYKDLPGRSIVALQKYASQIDISNFFILLLTSNNIEAELETARTLYSSDECAIRTELIDNLPIVKLPTDIQDTFCVLPWMHLYIGPDGNILPCCVADQKFPIGNIKNQPINEIVTSDKFNRIRSNMIQGLRSKECSYCYDQEDSKITSMRSQHNKKYPFISAESVNQDGTIDQFKPIDLDIRLNNICNLKCRMCSGYFSSAIAQEEAELFGNTNSVDASLRLQQRKSKFSEIVEYLPSTEKIYFAGGEPLLASEHYEILKSLIDCGNTDLEIVYNTNFTTLQYRDISVLDLWKHFSNVTVGASLDAHGIVAEYVRHGTNWATIESNLKLLKTHCPTVNFRVASTIGLLNVQSLIDLQRIWHTDQLLDISKFSMNTMIEPAHLTVRVLPTHHKQRLEALITAHIKWCQDNSSISLANQWRDLLNYMWSEDHSHHLDDFKRLTISLDAHRKESLLIAVPELSDLL